MKYRAEVDGLRAIAVIPVILFHAGFEIFSGGFIGVDVFFVISGYLITTIILSEKEKGTFSLINFYERRARRILPPLFLVMFCSLPFAWLWLFPSDMKDFSESLVAVSVFSSNILFWLETGYWGVDNELKPLLHTWSLAVEEQYYLLFPLFLMAMWKYRRRWIFGSFVLLAVISLFASQWASYNRPTAGFFLLPTRAWELAIGAGIAFYFLYKKQGIQAGRTHKFITEAMGIVGLMLIGYSVLVFNESTPFPGLFALFPTVGTGLVIMFSSKETLVGKLLGSKIPVAIGLISYSAYLWHQPLFAFSRHRSLTEPSELMFLLLSVLTFFLAYLSWRYVERPFRSKDRVSSRAILIFGATGSALFIAIGLAGHITDGFNGLPFKNKLTQDVIEKKWAGNYGLSKTCEESFTLSPDCRTSDDPEILVWGDSFAMHLVPGIMASNPEAKIIQMTKSRCGPFFGVAPVSRNYPVNWAEGCLEFTGEVRKWIESNNGLKYVVVSSPFEAYVNEEDRLLSRAGDLTQSDIHRATEEFLETLDEISSFGVVPVVFSPPPENSIDLGRCLAKAEWNQLGPDKCDFNIQDMSTKRKDAYQFLERIDEEYRVIRLDGIMCNGSICKSSLESVWLYRDAAHLSNSGSAALGKKYDFYKMIIESDRR